jgi:hypothetical protein
MAMRGKERLKYLADFLVVCLTLKAEPTGKVVSPGLTAKASVPFS